MSLNLFQAINDLRYYFSESGRPRGPFKLGRILELVEPYTLFYGGGIRCNTSKDAEEIEGIIKCKQRTSELNRVFSLFGIQNDWVVGSVRMFAAPLPYKFYNTLK